MRYDTLVLRSSPGLPPGVELSRPVGILLPFERRICKHHFFQMTKTAMRRSLDLRRRLFSGFLLEPSPGLSQRKNGMVCLCTRRLISTAAREQALPDVRHLEAVRS